ncbi:hypothetical protein B7494_g377 [Chlorociboria aeruginascens]|nr:hypothetical protein B7494_g377 [Chlorociboria aeruginascens]
MSDPASAKKGLKKWTDAERLEFLLRVIDQSSMKTPKFADINMEGRTPRALENEWAKIKAMAAKYKENGSGDDLGETAKPAATPNKKKLVKADADKDNDEPGKKHKPVTPRKRKTPVKKKPEPEPMPEVEFDNSTPDNSERGGEE